MGNGGGSICLGYQVIHHLVSERNPEGTYDIIRSDITDNLVDKVLYLLFSLLNATHMCSHSPPSRGSRSPSMAQPSGTTVSALRTPITRGMSPERAMSVEGLWVTTRTAPSMPATMTIPSLPTPSRGYFRVYSSLSLADPNPYSIIDLDLIRWPLWIDLCCLLFPSR